MTVTNFLSEVKDPRNMRGKRYNLAAILRLIVAGLLCNCNNIASIARFKKFLSKKLLQNLGFYDGITPCYSTLTIMLRKMNPKDLHDAIVKVISGIKETKEFQEVHIDGKTLRGSKDLENRAIQVLTGFNNKTKCVINFEEILNKDENKAMLEILQKFDIQRATITADAAFDHSDICEEIIQQGADFAICLKGNEANLLRATEQAFSNSKQENVRIFEKDVEYNHGRIEQRKIEVIDMPWEYLDGHRHIKQLCRITRRREQKNKGNYTEETAYMITSLSSSASAEMLLDLNRKHWSCENNLNWVKDRVFMEDKSTIRKDNAPIVLSLLRSFVISIIATISTKITETREYYSHYKQSVYTLFCNLRL